MRQIQRAAVAWVAAVFGLLAIHVLVPQRSGPLALSEVLEPWIVLTGLLAVPFAVATRSRPAMLAAAVLVGVVLIRYLPAWISFPPPGPARLTVAAWNIELGANGGARVTAGLADVEVDVLAVEELQPAMAAALVDDAAIAARYPYRVLAPDSTVYGVGLLSRHPILEQASSNDPTYVRALVDTPGTTSPTVVYAVHLLPPVFQTVLGVPVALDTDGREQSMAAIRSLIDADLAAGRSVVVLGDLNTTEREPAYTDFTAGLRDAHLDAGLGPGLTWRPDELRGLPFGVLRIDYNLSTPDLVATSSHVTCRDLSDHCIVEATFDKP